MRGKMSWCRFEISNHRENKFCSHAVSFGLHLKQPDIFIDICRHFISGSVYIIITRHEISFLSKRLMWNPYLRWVSNACALNATPNESTLIHFVLGKLCSHENLMPVWDFISVKMTDIKSIPFWVSFRPNSCEHK